MLLGLLTVLLGPSKPSILLLDDIEHGLHPLAQKSLLDVLSRVMKRFPELQVLASTIRHTCSTACNQSKFAC